MCGGRSTTLLGLRQSLFSDHAHVRFISVNMRRRAFVVFPNNATTGREREHEVQDSKIHSNSIR